MVEERAITKSPEAGLNPKPVVLPARHALSSHWQEYLIEAAGLGTFMISAAIFDVLLEYPYSPIHTAISNAVLRRVLMGVVMGVTAIALIYSPMGRRSGAHFNPAVTLSFFRLGKVYPWDAVFYIAAQFLGGIAGMTIAAAVLGKALKNPSVEFAATVPGPTGIAVAFMAELIMSAALMYVVLTTSNAARLSNFTGIFAGLVLALNIAVGAPYSGTSLNPARTFASAVPAQLWTAIWIYFTAPPLGMLIADEVYLRSRRFPRVICAKLQHDFIHRCIFRCGYTQFPNEQSVVASGP